MDDFMRFLKSNKFQRPPTHIILLVFVLCYFFVFGVFMAHIGGQPDQRAHGYYSQRFTETWGIPEDDPEVPFVITGQPFLYYWINGAISKIVQWFAPDDSINNIFLWRLVSVLMSTVTVYYLYKLTTKLTGNPYAGVLASFFLSNTLMFVFNSGGINYDNLMNLGSMAAIYHLVNIYKGENYFSNTAAMGSWLIVAALSKEQALLVAFVVFVPWLFFSIKHSKQLFFKFQKKHLIIGFIFISFIVLFIALYGVNYFHFGRLTPGCTQIKPSEQCTGYAHRWEYRTNVDLTTMWAERDYFINPIQYAFTYWIIHIARSIWGILSHNTFVPMLATGLHTIFALWGVFCLVRHWDKNESAANALIFIVIGFTAYLFYFNYRTEVKFSFMHFGVTGRYLLPVFGVFLALMTHYFLKIRSITIKRLSLILAIILYFAGGLGMFLSRYAEIFVHWRIYFF
jgi:hypothetical protein